MLTASQMATVCYGIDDGSYVCPRCFENIMTDGQRHDGVYGICEYAADEMFSPEGHDCDECGTEIVERQTLCADCAGREYDFLVPTFNPDLHVRCDWCGKSIEDPDEEEDKEEDYYVAPTMALPGFLINFPDGRTE